jgi:prepilin-type N-terminal cleavage/methylation domain-containing protein
MLKNNLFMEKCVLVKYYSETGMYKRRCGVKRSGFSLVELMVVIVIIGVLAAVATPKFLNATNKAKTSEFPSIISSIIIAEMIYSGEEGKFAHCPWLDADVDGANDNLISYLGLTIRGSYYEYGTRSDDGTTFFADGWVSKTYGGLDLGTKVSVSEDLQFTYEPLEQKARLISFAPTYFK